MSGDPTELIELSFSLLTFVKARFPETWELTAQRQLLPAHTER